LPEVVLRFVSNPYLARYFATRRRLKVGLVIAGAIAGALGGAALTVLGKIVAGAPPATVPNYLWNMVSFGLIGAVLGPVITWSALRNVPLWRTVVEPLVAGVAAAGVGVLVGSGTVFLVLAPLGVGAACVRLSHSYRNRTVPQRMLDEGDA
jgi:hypothetical protein